jgi:hypothetical protein
MILTSYLNFTAVFDLIGYPTLKLQDTGVYPDGIDANLVFEITQPDGVTIECPAIQFGGNTQQLLRLGSDQKYQCGQYKIKLKAYCDDDYSEIVRTFEMGYHKTELDLVQDFDLLTPRLFYRDKTDYDENGFTVTQSNILWDAEIVGIGTKQGVTSIFDLSFNGNYYSAYYNIDFERTLTYQSDTYAWLFVTDKYTDHIETYASQPPSLLDMLASVSALMTASMTKKCGSSCADFCKYVLAMTITQNIITSLSAGDTGNITVLMNQFINVTNATHLNVTNNVINEWNYNTVIEVTNNITNPPAIELDIAEATNTVTLSALINKTVMDINLDGTGRKFVEGLATDIPDSNVFIFVKATGQLIFGGIMNPLQWLKIKYS